MMCEAPDCDRDVLAKSRCRIHYARFRKYGSFDLPDKPVKRCTVEDCDRIVRCSGLCSPHYKRFQTKGHLELEKAVCEMCGVEFPKHGRARWCPEHRAEGARQYTRDWHARNIEREKRWREENKEAMQEARRRWMEANREKARAWVWRRRARIREATVFDFDPRLVQQRVDYYGGKCWLCGDVATAIDHVKPLNKGGPHMPANLRPICKPCNSAKRDTWPLAEFGEKP